MLLSLRIGAPTGNRGRPALLNIVSSVHDQIHEKAQAKLKARLEIVNLRIEQSRRKEEAARRASDGRTPDVTQEAWPKSLMHVKKILPSKDARLLVRWCRDNPLVDPIFARKKFWVCELCCCKYNKQARAVFQAAEASQLADLQSDIWARIHTLETLSASMEAAFADAGRGGGGAGGGAGGGGDARAGWEADKRREMSLDFEDFAAKLKGFGSCSLPRIKPRQLRLPMVPGAMRAIGSRNADTSHDMLPQAIVEFSPEVCYDQPEGEQDLAHAHTRYDESALPRGGTQWRKRPPLAPMYPVTEVPAPCSPRRYDSLNNFSARMRDFKVMPADGQHRSWWRPAGMPARGWAEAPEIPEGFRLPEIVPLPTVAQDADTARAAYLAEAARLRTLPKTTHSLVDKAQEASAATAEGVRRGIPAARGGVLGDDDGVRHGAVYVGWRMKKGGPQGEERIAGLTPRARWFQPKVHVGGGENKVGVGSDGDVPALPLPPRAQAWRRSQTHRPATNLPEVLGVRLDMAVDIAEMVRTVKLDLNRPASPTQSRTEARSPRTARSSRTAQVRRQLQHSASVQSPSSRLDASLLTPADIGVLKDVQFVLISRFRDCYAAYAAFGGSTQDWKLSPSCFYRTLLRLGVEEGLVVATMHALAPFCSCGHLSLHDFVSLFSWHSAQGIVGAGHEGKSINEDGNHDCDAPPVQAHVATGELPAESMAPSTTMHRRQPAPLEDTLTAKGGDTALDSQLPGVSLDAGDRSTRHGSDRDSKSGQRASALRAMPSVNTGWSLSVHSEPQQDNTTEGAHDSPTQSAVVERERWERSRRVRTLPSVISWYVHAPLPPKCDESDEHKGNRQRALDPHAPKPSASSKRAVKHHQLHNQQSAMPLAQEQELQELFVSLRSSYPQGQKPRPGRPLRTAYQISQVPAIDFKWGEESGNRAKDKAKSRNLKVEHAYGTPMLPRAPAKAKAGPNHGANSGTAEAGGKLKTTLAPPELQTAASASESVKASAAKVDPVPDHVMMTATDLSADETDTCHTVGYEDDFDHEECDDEIAAIMQQPTSPGPVPHENHGQGE